jgi:hypothetical protein
MTETTPEQAVASEIILLEAERQIKLLSVQNDALNLKVKRLMAEFEHIDKEADELESTEPQVFDAPIIGDVVRLRDYQRLQLASAKARAMLQVKIESLTKAKQ